MSRDHGSSGPPRAAKDGAEAWSIQDSKALYRLDGWGGRYFTINEAGHAAVLTSPAGEASADLHDIVAGLRERGIDPPVLLRFGHILKDRLHSLHRSFAAAIAENDYSGRYIAVYPTKVNEQRQIVEQVLEASEGLRFGLEVGSLAELVAVVALTADQNDRLIVCNGFKGPRFLEAAFMAAKLGRRIVIVADSFSEVKRILDLADEGGVSPVIGVRVKLSSQGAGRWRNSTGSKAKFGLSVTEMLDAVELLKERGRLDSLRLIHCHIGSQIEDIRAVKDAIDEISRLYVELARLGVKLEYVDIGGGLGVDYDGTQTGRAPSMNYSMDEYASGIVYRLATVCQQEDLPHPTIVSESGRAMVAHGSILVFDIIDAASVTRASETLPTLSEVQARETEIPQPLLDLYDTLEVEPDRLVECYHDANHAYRSALELFSLGFLPLEMRGLAERLYWACLQRISRLLPELEEQPPELAEVPDLLSEVYFGNFSTFQSLPDAWAIQQVYPVLPLQRLDEEPTVRCVIADITCDSDGKLDRFIGPDGLETALNVHPLRPDEPYYMGVFLVGAYQEALGDLHNLFGDTNVAQIKVEPDGGWWLEDVVEGDTSREVLAYVQYDAETLHGIIMRNCQTAIREGRITASESRSLLAFYKSQLDGYTYIG